MKLAASNIAWPLEREVECLRIMKDHGFNYLEIAPTKYWPDLTQVAESQVIERRQLIEDCGLSVCSAQALLFGKSDLKVFGTDSEKLETINYLKIVIDVCASIGARKLVFGSPRNRLKGTRGFLEALSESSEFFRVLGKYCQQKNVVLCIEPNSTKYGCDFITNVDQAIQLVAAVGSEGFGLHLDTGNMIMESESICEAISKGEGLIQHFHVSAPFLGPIVELDSLIDVSGWRMIRDLKIVKTVEMLIKDEHLVKDHFVGSLEFLQDKLS